MLRWAYLHTLLSSWTETDHTKLMSVIEMISLRVCLCFPAPQLALAVLLTSLENVVEGSLWEWAEAGLKQPRPLTQREGLYKGGTEACWGASSTWEQRPEHRASSAADGPSEWPWTMGPWAARWPLESIIQKGLVYNSHCTQSAHYQRAKPWAQAQKQNKCQCFTNN